MHYHFVDDAAFDAMVEADELLEWAVVHGTYRYGTPREPVKRSSTAGARRSSRSTCRVRVRSRRRCREPSSSSWPLRAGTLVRRLVGRGTESEAERERRLESARVEMAAEPEFDVTIVNADVRQATDDLVHLMGLRPA